MLSLFVQVILFLVVLETVLQVSNFNNLAVFYPAQMDFIMIV